MSKLQELIDRLCPEGVEFKTIKQTVGLNRGSRLTKSQLDENAPYEVYHGSKDTPLGNYHQFNAPKHTTIVVNTGGIGGVKFMENDFWCSDGSFWLGQVNYINPKFIYYYLSGFEEYFASKKRIGGVPTIDREVVESFPIPVPPIAVQDEIVKILDRFADYAAELQAELQARRLQYEYYRNLLLTFNPSAYGCGTDDAQKISVIARGGHSYEIQWKTMGEICRKICSGGTPLTSNKSYYAGTIPWLRTQEVDWRDVYDTEIKISEEAVKNSSAKLIPANCVIVAMYGATAAKSCINKIPLTTNQACCNLEIDDSLAYYKYVYYWLCNSYETLKSMGEGSQNNINGQKIKSFLIPIPPLEVQEKIVAILDRFETLVNDLSKGLPAEIEAVKARYEYYRNKLLTFKQLSA